MALALGGVKHHENHAIGISASQQQRKGMAYRYQHSMYRSAASAQRKWRLAASIMKAESSHLGGAAWRMAAGAESSGAIENAKRRENNQQNGGMAA